MRRSLRIKFWNQAQKIDIHQVDLSTILGSLETSCNNVTSLLCKLCDTSSFTKEIRDKLSKVNEDLQTSAQQLQLDPIYSFSHYTKIRFLIDMKAKLLREQAKIRATLVNIQGMILPKMDALQKHIAHAKMTIHDNNISIPNHMIELLAEVQVALYTCKVL